MLLNREYWFPKLVKSLFSLKSAMILFSWKRGGMQGIILWCKNVLDIDQYVFGLVRGSANLLENLMWHFSFNSSIYMFSWFCKASNFSKRDMFLLEQQCDLNAKFFSTINFLISLFIQGRSLLSQIIVSCGIMFWIMLTSVLVKK